MADWTSLSIQVPGKDLMQPVLNVLETLVIFLEVLKAILNTITTFLIDFGNPLRVLVEALIRLVEELLLSLKASGVSGLFHIPDPLDDANFDKNRGADAFLDTFKASLFDSRDFNRPQPRAGSTQGGFILLMVLAENVYSLIGNVKQLLRFFGKEFISPRYEAPRNLMALPMTPDGLPILRVVDIFHPEAKIGLAWDLPTSTETPDPGFSDLVSRVANEFVPPNFLIEKSTINPTSQRIDLSTINTEGTAGLVEHSVSKTIAGTSQQVDQRVLLKDDNNDLLIKFTEYIVLDNLSITALLGQTGKVRWIDSDVVPDGLYHYRVRAFSGDLAIQNGQILWGAPEYTDSRAEARMRWPSQSDSVCVMGKPSGLVSIRAPKPPIDADGGVFDVVGNLKRVFQAAFTLGFHQNVEGNTGLIGQASMTKLAGSAASYQPDVLRDIIQSSPGTTPRAKVLAANSLTLLEFPWEVRSVRRQSARLADAVASAMIQSGSPTTEYFRELLQTSNKKLQNSLVALTGDDPNRSVEDKGLAFVGAWDDDSLRQSLLGVISYIKSFTGGGVSPDWITVSPLRDIVPWTGEILYYLLDKIQALLDSFSGVNKEIKDFIDLLTRKIDTLERLLKFLIEILDFIEALQLDVYVLAVPSVSGDATTWVQAVDSAGNKPPGGPGHYSAGVALAYVGADVTAITTAFKLIFGI